MDHYELIEKMRFFFGNEIVKINDNLVGIEPENQIFSNWNEYVTGNEAENYVEADSEAFVKTQQTKEAVFAICKDLLKWSTNCFNESLRTN